MRFLRRERSLALLIVLCTVIGVMSGCASTATTSKGSITVTDQVGNTCTVDGPAERIVSGYYVSTSACIALGLKDKLVGIEEKSESRPIYKLSAPELLKTAVNVGNAKNFDVEACVGAKPDLVILPKKAKDYVSVLNEMGIPAIVVDPEDNAKLDEMIEIIAVLTGTEERGEKLVSRRNEILDLVSERTKDIPENERKSTYMCNPGDFMRTASKDMYQAELLRLAGAKNASDELPGSEWTDISAEQLLSMDPEVVIVPANGTASDRPDYVQELYKDTVFSTIPAVQNDEVYFMPYGYESWDSPVPSGVLGAMWLMSALHPELCSKDELEETVSDFYLEFYGFEVKEDVL